MILKWLGAEVWGVARGWLLLPIVIAALIFLIVRSERADDTANRAAGATQERNTHLETTIARGVQANAAREEIADPASRTRYEQCLRSARAGTAENCKRLLPDYQTDQHGDATR